VEKARKPKRRTVIEKVERATISDRFGIPLATNQIQYNAAVCYSDIRQIPSVRWETREGKRVRVQKRLEYIEELSSLLAGELGLEAQVIEDLIHGKASLFPHTPFVIKENLSEQEYFRLKALEKDFAGIRTERSYHRVYPQGKVGCDVVGYMGAINMKEYQRIATEIKELQNYFYAQAEVDSPPILPKGFEHPLEVRERLKALQEKSYTIQDLVGKAGIESSFDAQLRGYAGKKTYEIDTKGNIIRELPGSREKLPGHCLHLSISAELQQFAEELLIANESVRELRHFNGEPDLGAPWIKGGAIVVMDPNTGEVLALASYPRIDPNDFVPSSNPIEKAKKQEAIHKWLEDEHYIAALWEGRELLERERLNPNTSQVYNETLLLSWNKYLEAILDDDSAIREQMRKIATVKRAYDLVACVEQLSEMVGEPHIPTLIDAIYKESPHIPIHDIKPLTFDRATTTPLIRYLHTVLQPIPHNKDKLLLLDLCRLHKHHPSASIPLLEFLDTLSLADHHLMTQQLCAIKQKVKAAAKEKFHNETFQQYRLTGFKEFLKQKRKEEKEKKQYARPYTDYLEEMERKLFQQFWQENAPSLIYQTVFSETSFLQKTLLPLDPEVRKEWLASCRSYEQLTEPLFGKYRSLRSIQGVQLQKHLAAAFYPIAGFGYGRSQAYRQSTPQGSLFKMIVGYEALLERYEALKLSHPSPSQLNPLSIIDDLKPHPVPKSPHQILGYTLDGKPIQRAHKGGHLIKSSHSHIGKVDLISAIEQSSNIYFSLLASDHIKDPATLIKTCQSLGLGVKTGIELPGEIAGVLPQDLSFNLSGLYAFAIGQHSLIVTPLQSALYMSALANHGIVVKPTILHTMKGEEPSQEYQDPFGYVNYPFQEPLSLVGIDFPLFTSVCKPIEHSYVWRQSTEIKQQCPFPLPVKQMLSEGMYRVMNGSRGTARPPIIYALHHNPTWAKHYNELKSQFLGKTGTAEVLYKHSIDAQTKGSIRNHIWFGGTSFKETDHQKWENPELTVIVYLRHSDAGGKETAPLATEIVKKYRELLKKYPTGDNGERE
jgi:cell division protein FtsI/penicillin-binding protein 2